MDYYPYYEYGHGGLAEAGSMAGITLAVVLVFYLLAFGFSILVYIASCYKTRIVSIKHAKRLIAFSINTDSIHVPIMFIWVGALIL